MYSYSATDTGMMREMNQDYFFASDTPVGNLANLYIVADGMGGHKAGDYASRYTVDRIVAAVSRCEKTNPVEILCEAIARANNILIRESEDDEDKKGMGTTLVIATVSEGKAVIANIGDSRLYYISGGIFQITRDHSWVQEMVRAGDMEEDVAREHKKKNIITRAVGVTPDVEADYFEIPVRPEDRLLLCTDGLTNMVSDEEILKIVNRNPEISGAVKELLTTANRNGGSDNITALIAIV